MADTVNTNVVFNGNRKYTANFTNVSDGTGETDVVKVDISALIGPDKVNAPTSVVIEQVQWSIQGFSSVRIEWDHTTDDEALVLGAGNGYLDFRSGGGLRDPRSAGGTGDVLFTTASAISGASYDITLFLRLKA